MNSDLTNEYRTPVIANPSVKKEVTGDVPDLRSLPATHLLLSKLSSMVKR